ncbi:hypothetical protein PR048_028570 [Dryococelus australis]|uniref:Uncharacterized protein n=1 Tax=Dryococelus australis TaxID=614101 RepID=A0ABQ9GDQ2_9NEOP|nr:hypothetical protein PR048_028570 [Dryococelus australis]
MHTGWKRKRNPSEWKRNIAKNAKVKGYVDSKGKWKMDCFSRFTEEVTVNILRRVLDHSIKDEQDVFIQSVIEAYEINQRRPCRDEGSRANFE